MLDSFLSGDILLHIFLHGPESASKNGIVKTFTHTSIPIHPCTLLKKTHKQQQQKVQLTKHDAFMYWSSSCPECWWATFRMFGTCSTSEALSPKTVLTKNSCESVQQILQHSLAEKMLNSPNTMPFPWLVLFLSNVVVGDGQEAWQMLLRTVPHRRTSRLGQYWQKSFVDLFNTHFSISRTAIPFLTVSTISYSWMASTAPQADSWWPGHVEPDDVVIADIAGQALDIFLHGPESASKNGIVKTFTHTSIPIHPCTLLNTLPCWLHFYLGSFS